MKFDLMGTVHLTTSKEPAPPTKIFDNMGIVGSAGTSAVIIETDEGLILLDCLWPGAHFAGMIEDGMRELGYDPADITTILISHGHPDHTGCADHFMKNYGAVPYMSEVDYHFGKKFCAESDNPDWTMDFEVDRFVEGGQTFSVGGLDIRVFSTPGHTPGGLSFLVPVRDQGRPHLAALWGGSAPPANADDCRTYLKSLEYFCEQCVKYGVDAEFSTHPILNNGVERMAVMRNRIDQVPNPFVIGTENYLRFAGLFREMVEDTLAKLGQTV